MEALVQMPHGSQLLYPGDTFFATPIDREYYLKHKRAKDVEETPAPAPAVTPPAQPPAPAPSSRRRTAAAAPAPAPAADDSAA